MPEIPTNAPHWLIVGSSRSVVQHIDPAIALGPEIMATCNAGIALLVARGKMPDLFAIADHDSRRWAGLYAHESVQVVTVDRFKRIVDGWGVDMGWRDPIVLEETGLAGPEDEWLTCDNGKVVLNHGPWKRGRHVWCGTTGALLVQLAANNVPEGGTVSLVGMDGYLSGPHGDEIDTFDGRRGGHLSAEFTAAYAKILGQVVAGRPDVEWRMYGDPAFEVPAAANFQMSLLTAQA